jgi:hypothetical protein
VDDARRGFDAHASSDRRGAELPCHIPRGGRSSHRASPARNLGCGESLKLLLDEMYSAAHAEALRAADIQATTILELGLAGSPDPEVFDAAIAEEAALHTENVADFARISAERLLAGQHHPGLLIALSSRFSRRPAGIPALVAAIADVAAQSVADRVIYLQAGPVSSARRGRRVA